MNLNLDFKNASSIIMNKIELWYELLVKSLPNMAVAIVVLFLFVFIAMIVRKVTERIIFKVSTNRAITNLAKSSAYILTILGGLFIALEILNLEKTVTSILAGAGVIGLALGFAFQEIAANFVSGILIAFRKPYQIGDIIEINDFFGEVTKIDLRTTSITDFNGLEIIIPNKQMFTEAFTNYTTTPKRRVVLEVGVSYGDDLEKVEKVTHKAIENIEERLESEDVDVFFESFGGSSVNLSARFWVKYPNDKAYLKAQHSAIKNILKLYNENDIVIPFPIRTLDFGIKGGEKLSEVIDFPKDN